MEYLKYVNKRKLHEKKAEKYRQKEKAHPCYVSPPKRQKLDVNRVPFSFLKSQQADKTSFKQLVDNSDIWVGSAVLKALYKTSPSLTKYARMLMWDVILTRQDILTMNQLKSQSVGFVKLFGEKNFRDVYGRDKKNMITVGGKLTVMQLGCFT
ncbi:hypothetical protein RvY_02826-3 [Ramazzottius varieornatus]|uniref:Uncharacterized protein n=1 Tax=Ramazzottius varieornatus TaxID=947166 RepID=A0A1D1UT34_RAMVA|nr:hypothetical protein RvY_02826-3 [Ramazzottius varieornatus]